MCEHSKHSAELEGEYRPISQSWHTGFAFPLNFPGAHEVQRAEAGAELN
jgi:hypothetical protein